MQRIRRLGRWMINGLTVLSVVMCVVAGVMWMRSYSQWAVIGWNMPGSTPAAFTDRFVGVNSSNGSLVLIRRNFTWLRGHPAAGRLSANEAHGYFDGPYTWFVREDLAARRVAPYSSPDPSDRSKCITFPGGFVNSFDMPATTMQRGMTGFDLVVPAAPICAFLAAGPIFMFIRWRRKRRPAKPGQCVSCSYDLTGNVSGVCPECGTAMRKV